MAQMRLLATVLGATLSLVCAQGYAAPLPDIVMDGTNLYPESMSSAADGSVYIGSMKGIVFRARPGSAKATPWIKPTAHNGILTLLGVLVDEPDRTLWLCSSPGALRSPPVTGTASLMAFDLKSGRQRGNYPFPAPASVCNDISVAPNGDVYASDTPNGRILRLAKGSKSLTVFAEDARLKGIDGLVFGGNGVLYVNNVSRNQLLIVDIHPDGTAGPITQMVLSQPVAGPDGFRFIGGNRFLLAEGNAGRVDLVTISGIRADIRVLHEGLQSPPAVTLVGNTVYALEGKILYLISPTLKGKDPGPFKAYAVPLPPL
jgi:sugar lactone lactonase YvrE